jgi:hypothetical protein
MNSYNTQLELIRPQFQEIEKIIIRNSSMNIVNYRRITYIVLSTFREIPLLTIPQVSLIDNNKLLIEIDSHFISKLYIMSDLSAQCDVYSDNSLIERVPITYIDSMLGRLSLKHFLLTYSHD